METGLRHQQALGDCSAFIARLSGSRNDWGGADKAQQGELRISCTQNNYWLCGGNSGENWTRCVFVQNHPGLWSQLNVGRHL